MPGRNEIKIEWNDMTVNELNISEKMGRKVTAATIVLLIFTVASGVLRKWVFNNSNFIGSIILFIQLILPYLYFVMLRKMQHPFKYSIYIWYTLLILFLALNPMNLTIFHGILGILLHMGFWLLIGLYFKNQSLYGFKLFIKISIVVSIVEIVLGFIQYSLPPTHILNTYADMEKLKEVATVGGSVRITGTFSYLGGYYSFMLFYNFLIWAMLRMRYNALLLILMICAGFGAAFMTGSRSTVYTYVFLLIVMLITEGRNGKVISKILGQLVVAIFLVITVNYFLGDRFQIGDRFNLAWNNFSSRMTTGRETGEEKWRIISPIEEVIDFTGEYPIAGVGLGATYQGATAVFGTSKYLYEYGYYEEEGERIILEGGYALFLFRILLFVFLYRRLHIPPLAKASILLYSFMYVPIIFNVYSAVFLFLGLIILDKTYFKDIPLSNFRESNKNLVATS